jgi:hypothetical protein
MNWNWNMAHQGRVRRDPPHQDPERRATIKLAIVALAFIASLGLMYWLLFA